jgi:hypothetical protein
VFGNVLGHPHHAEHVAVLVADREDVEQVDAIVDRSFERAGLAVECGFGPLDEVVGVCGRKSVLEALTFSSAGLSAYAGDPPTVV